MRELSREGATPPQQKYLGNRRPFEGLDTFPTPGVEMVSCISDEVTANCPVTGAPDFYTVIIEYQPGQVCIESKSLKLYFQSFRDQAMFGEAMSVKIATDVIDVLGEGAAVNVRVIQKARGGIEITSSTSFDRRTSPESESRSYGRSSRSTTTRVQ